MNISKKVRDVSKGGGGGSPEEPPYNVSRGRYRYVTLPLLAWNSTCVCDSHSKVRDIYPLRKYPTSSEVRAKKSKLLSQFLAHENPRSHVVGPT